MQNKGVYSPKGQRIHLLPNCLCWLGLWGTDKEYLRHRHLGTIASKQKSFFGYDIYSQRVRNVAIFRASLMSPRAARHREINFPHHVVLWKAVPLTAEKSDCHILVTIGAF